MIDLDELERLAKAATPGLWTWWTSNSVKRLTASNQPDGGVLSAYMHPNKTYADIRIGAADMAHIEAANPAAILELVVSVRKLQAENAELRRDAELWKTAKELATVDYNDIGDSWFAIRDSRIDVDLNDTLEKYVDAARQQKG